MVDADEFRRDALKAESGDPRAGAGDDGEDALVAYSRAARDVKMLQVDEARSQALEYGVCH